MTKEQLTLLVEDLRAKAIEERDANVSIIQNKLQSYVQLPIKVNADIRESDYYKVEVVFLEPNGKENFGSSFTIYYYKKDHSRYHKEGVSINNGTIGEYTKENIFQLQRVKLIYNIWEHIEEIEEMFANIKCPIDTVYIDKYYELQNILHEERREKERQQRQAIETKFEIGTKFHAPNQKYEIIKITPKRVYYAQYSDFYGKYMDWNKFFDKHVLINMFLSDYNPMKFDEEGEANDTTSI